MLTVLPAPKVRPKTLRDEIEQAFQRLGGVDALVNWAEESTVNRRIFYSVILPKIVPREMSAQISGDDGGPIRMSIEWLAPTPQTPPLPEPAAAAMNIVNQVILDAEDE